MRGEGILEGLETQPAVGTLRRCGHPQQTSLGSVLPKRVEEVGRNSSLTTGRDNRLRAIYDNGIERQAAAIAATRIAQERGRQPYYKPHSRGAFPARNPRR